VSWLFFLQNLFKCSTCSIQHQVHSHLASNSIWSYVLWWMDLIHIPMIVLVLLTAQCNPPWTCPFQAFIPGKLIAGEFHGFFLREHYELWINADDKINLSNIWPWGLRVRPSSFNFFCWAKSWTSLAFHACLLALSLVSFCKVLLK